jgi:hypothetical protein
VPKAGPRFQHALEHSIWKKQARPAGHRCRPSRIALSKALACAHGCPKAAPDVEPDVRSKDVPTEGSEELLCVVQARRDGRVSTFAAKLTKSRGIWCSPGED